MRIPSPVAVGVGLSTIAMYSISAVSSDAAAAPSTFSSSAPSRGAPPTSASASTSAEVLHLDALAVPGAGTLADVGIGTSTGSVSGDAGGTSASARNLDAALAGHALPDLLATADQKAPADHLAPESSTAASGEIPGLATVGVSTASAQARWTGARTCPAPGEPLTTSSVSTADLATARVPGVGAILTLPGTASTRQSTTLADAGGTGMRKVVSTARGSTADLGLLGDRLQVAVIHAPTLKATASGAAGGATVDWSAPAVTVTVDGERHELPADGSPVDFTSPDNPLLHVELSLGQLRDERLAQDGTSASARASVLHVHASLGSGDLGATVLDTDLFPLAASATAPAGGVDCGAGSEDSDGDGLTNAEETSGSANDEFGNAPTDPNRADSDGDGLSDGDELTGAQNGDFGHAPSNPNKADTDGDGLSDGAETSGRQNDGFGNAPTDPSSADSDGDGLSDGREVDHTKTDPNNPDTDGGTVSDGDEVSAGTDPLNPADDVVGGDGGGGTVNDPDDDGLGNQDEVQSGTNPVDDDTDSDGLGDGQEVNHYETEPTDGDTDGDGLGDGREVNEIGTDPKDKDTDNDGLGDGREVEQTRTDPLDKDTDNDKLGDGREVKGTKTNPKRKDTDRDGLWDRREVRGAAPKRYPSCKTNPTRADSDNDGLKDGRELKRTDTNPCDRDSDDGGVNDGKEVKAGSDPNDPHSTPKDPRGSSSLASRLLEPTG